MRSDRAADFVGEEPFVHLVSDHLYISRQPRRCAEQLVELADAMQCAVSAIQPTRESMFQYYGAIGGVPVAGRPGLYQIDCMLEKPTPTQAEQRLVVPGLRAGHYLCLFGMHVLTPPVMELLGQMVAEAQAAGTDQPVMLTPALEKLAQRERYLAMELEGSRYNIGVKYGVLTAQLALALSRQRPRGDPRSGDRTAGPAIKEAPMAHELITIITGGSPEVRDRSLDAFCRAADATGLIEAADELDRFRRTSQNLYERVRAIFFLAAIYRYHLPEKLPAAAARGRPSAASCTSWTGVSKRRSTSSARPKRRGPSDAIASALAAAYHALGFQTLADQVRRSVRSVRGNQWMFRMGHPSDHPLGVRRELLRRASRDEPFPILAEQTPVRMDLSHSGWSDIFFLGMDFPEGARVLNVSVDLGVRGRMPSRSRRSKSISA